MTKEQKIKEVWRNWEHISVDGGVDENGWTNYVQSYGSFSINDFEQQHFLTGATIRPNALSGIETNNGWIKFAGNLPQENNWYWIKTIDDTLLVFWVAHKNKFVDNDNNYYFNSVTHYQTIPEPKPPIY